MNKKVKTVVTFGLGFFGGMYALSAMQMWLYKNGGAYTYFKASGHEYGDRKIVPPSSETEEETSE